MGQGGGRELKDQERLEIWMGGVKKGGRKERDRDLIDWKGMVWGGGGVEWGAGKIYWAVVGIKIAGGKISTGADPLPPFLEAPRRQIEII